MHGASDVVLLPYHKITGSSAFMTAMTLGRGVVASDLPYFREVLVGHEDAGRLFPAGDAASLAGAIREYLSIPAERRQSAARALARECAWDKVIGPVASALKQCVTKRSGSRRKEAAR